MVLVMDGVIGVGVGVGCCVVESCCGVSRGWQWMWWLM